MRSRLDGCTHGRVGEKVFTHLPFHYQIFLKFPPYLEYKDHPDLEGESDTWRVRYGTVGLCPTDVGERALEALRRWDSPFWDRESLRDGVAVQRHMGLKKPV